MTNTELPTQDGTYVLTTDGLARLNLTQGYVVAVGALEDVSKLAVGALAGRWLDTETHIVYWDNVIVLSALADALDLAARLGELAVWDNANAQEIRV
jgi:hypothetical protein